jgi:protein-L-isoaspartate(D-aspartate) O-methyltransferase
MIWVNAWTTASPLGAAGRTAKISGQGLTHIRNMAMNIEQARYNMIEQQIRPWNVLDPHVLELLGAVKREDFVPLAHKALAFVDMEIPLPGGQALLTPKVEARLVQEVNAQRHEKLLQIGVGSGYVTALLAHRAQRVIAVDSSSELVQLARANLQKSGVFNAEVRQAEAAAGAVADGPFDAIVLVGSVAQVPANLLQQLKVGGRLVAIVGDEPMMYATVVTRTTEKTFDSQQRWDTVAARLQGFVEPSRFKF